MIDFHSHILPEIDDGSQSVKESITMLEEEYEYGVRKVMLTPHFYAQKDPFLQFEQRRADSLKCLLDAAEGSGRIPGMYVGAEVYYFPNIGSSGILPELCLSGTNIMLLEMPFSQWTEKILDDVEKIVFEHKITLILAHIERYYDFQRRKDIWREIFSMPLYAQINTGSFLNHKKRFCLKFIKSGHPVVLGSDCHNMMYRPPNLHRGREVIEKKLGKDKLHEIDILGEKLLAKNEETG